MGPEKRRENTLVHSIRCQLTEGRIHHWAAQKCSWRAAHRPHIGGAQPTISPGTKGKELCSASSTEPWLTQGCAVTPSVGLGAKEGFLAAAGNTQHSPGEAMEGRRHAAQCFVQAAANVTSEEQKQRDDGQGENSTDQRWGGERKFCP